MSQGHTVLSANNLSAEPRLAYPTMVNIVSERSSCVICGIRSTSTLNCLQTKTFAVRAQFTHYSNSIRDILFLFHMPGVGLLVVAKVLKRSVIRHSENALNISKSHLSK